MNKNTQKRVTKTIEAMHKLYGCQGAEVKHIFKDSNNNDLILLIARTNGIEEYISFNNRYVWGIRVGFFCGMEEEYKRFKSLNHYIEIQ